MSEKYILDKNFYREKKVLVTGHTGFKGSWMCKVLQMMGADVIGYSLDDKVTEPSLFRLCHAGEKMISYFGDIRNGERLTSVLKETQPEIVIHMAAQPIVRESYKNPVDTYEINVMGVVRVLEAIRNTESVKSVVNVTTDKVYYNSEKNAGFTESDVLDGFDPYSNSKSCSELVTSCYRRSYFEEKNIAVSTVRAGNVIGGGDFAVDRILPDCARAALDGTEILIRNKEAVRPFQHVLDPICAYLMIAQKQVEHPMLAGNYNVGPDRKDCHTVLDIVEMFCKKWKKYSGKDLFFRECPVKGPHEAGLLYLDCEKLKTTFSWKPVWNLDTAMEKTVEWYSVFFHGENVEKCMEQQIGEFL